nr:aromatic amino acid lyase [Thauera sp.]
MTKALQLGQGSVTLDDLMAVVRQGHAVELTDAARAAMRVSEDWVAGLSDRMDRGEPTQAIYSINTGFGSLSGRQAFSTSAQARDLSRRLVISNAAGVGRLLDDEVVRAAMVIRAASLTRGYSAVRDVVVET